MSGAARVARHRARRAARETVLPPFSLSPAEVEALEGLIPWGSEADSDHLIAAIREAIRSLPRQLP